MLDEILNKIQECNNLDQLETIRVETLGKKGSLTQEFAKMKTIPGPEKKAFAENLNKQKAAVTEALDEKKVVLEKEALEIKLQSEKIDVTRFNNELSCGATHPVVETMNRIITYFQNLNFAVEEGPLVEDDFHNFEALNLPKYHPARDMQDTFFVNPNTVLRTHTSNVQIHLMENQDPPLRHICCGRVYRNEAVSYKSFCLFNQVEGLVINENSSFAEMKGTLEYFVKEMFGEGTKMRFRPSYFPFTEPSAEVDIWNEKLNQWMEILGCGMVNPNVLTNVGYDNKKYQGFAFGMGIERIAMIKYGIKDIRLFYQNDKRFLEQF